MHLKDKGLPRITHQPSQSTLLKGEFDRDTHIEPDREYKQITPIKSIRIAY